MNEQEHMLYRQYREKGCHAAGALRAARAVPDPSRPPLDWKDSRGSSMAGWGRGGWQFLARTEIDEYCGPQEMALGRFTDRWEPGAVDHWARGHHPGYRDRRTFRWFIPCNSYREHYEGLRQLNFGRHEAHRLARSYVLQDYQRAREMGECWVPLVVSVKVRRAGVELACASCGGIESDCGEDYRTEMAHDLAAEALHEARKNARELFADFVEAP